MKIVSEKTLSIFRGPLCCELCGKFRTCDPAHRRRRSQGRQDTVYNLLALCRPCHDGFDLHKTITEAQVLAAIAKRLDCETTDLTAAYECVDKLDKHASPATIARFLAPLTPAARSLVRDALSQEAAQEPGAARGRRKWPTRRLRPVMANRGMK